MDPWVWASHHIWYMMEVQTASDPPALVTTLNTLPLPSGNKGVTFQIRFQYNIKECDVNRDKVCNTEVNSYFTGNRGWKGIP